MSTEGVAPETGKSKRLLGMIFILNLILLGSLLYVTFARSFLPGGGVSVVLANDMLSPMLDLSMSYPGDTFALPRLDARKSVGFPIPVSGPFDVTLTFKDEQGNTIKQSFAIKPVGEFLVVIHVLPEFEETTVKSAEGKEEKLFKPSTTKVRVLTTFQGENVNI